MLVDDLQQIVESWVQHTACFHFEGYEIIAQGEGHVMLAFVFLACKFGCSGGCVAIDNMDAGEGVGAVATYISIVPNLKGKIIMLSI